MTTKNKIIIAVVVIISSVFFGVLIVLGFLDAAPLFGLLGVLVGALISEGSKYLNAERDRTHQLRLAAVDKRLQTHQKAYALWRKLQYTTYDDEKLLETVTECRVWWEQNCLYLEPVAREAFVKAYSIADLIPVTRHNYALAMDYVNILREQGELIVTSVGLPTIVEDKVADQVIK